MKYIRQRNKPPGWILICAILWGTCRSCSPSRNLLSLAPVPGRCRRYALCFSGRLLRELSCPSGTAFDPTRFGCTAEFHELCRAQENVQSQVQTVLSCPRKTTITYYPDYTKGCPSPQYFLCRDGELSSETCPKGQVFDEGVDMCVTSTSVVCGVAGPVCSAETRDSAVYADYTWGCPARQFIACYGDGFSVNFTCPEELYYNGAVKNCDYPDNVVCGDNMPL